MFAWQELEDLKASEMMSFLRDEMRINVWPGTMTVAVQFKDEGKPRQIYRKNVTEPELRMIFGDPLARIGKEKDVQWTLSQEQNRPVAKRSKFRVEKRIPKKLNKFHAQFRDHMRLMAEIEEKNKVTLEIRAGRKAAENLLGIYRKSSPKGESLLLRKKLPDGRPQ